MNINQENISEKEGNTNILETNITNINADLTESSTGRYLYGDYSEFEENRNFINILNDYISISNNIFVIHDKIIKLDQHIEETYNFQKDLHNRFTDFTKAMESSIYNFYSTHHLKVLQTLNEKSNEGKFFFDTKDYLMNSFQVMEKEYSRNLKNYQENIKIKTNDYYRNSIKLIQTWLAKGLVTFPYSFLVNLKNSFEMNLINDDGKIYYKITNTNSIIIDNRDGHEDGSKVLTYSFSMDESPSNFFYQKQKLSDFNIHNLVFPIGYKVSISKKLKRSFKLVSSIEDDKENSNKEPEKIILDNYFLSHIKLEKNKNIILGIANEISNSKTDKIIEINLNLMSNEIEKCLNETFDNQELKTWIKKNDLLTIDYIVNNEKKNIMPMIIDFFDTVDFKQIFNLCKSIIKNIEKTIDPLNLQNGFRLVYIELYGKKAIDHYIDKDGSNERIYYDKTLISRFLEIVAEYLIPHVEKIKEKSPVVGELILRYEMDGQPRKEYVLKTEDIKEQLNNFEDGKKILKIFMIN
ncbi:MAG TPA: hypothetical protein VFP25_06215 [Nitrososphaeraceae archaeon]|nr:hypothetical protein [Nitrososphaeraceae archaeon]